MSSRSRWASASGTIFLAIAWTIYALCASSHTPGSDGHYSWIYARSLAFDFDLDFRNDYALCGDPFEIGAITPAGRPGNIFYTGPPLVWTPAIWLLKQ